MPRGDRTGPAGMGPMTGRGMGYCAGYSVPGFANSGYGRGMGRGRGFGLRAPAPGFGLGRGGLPRSIEFTGYQPNQMYPLDEEGELSVLKGQEKNLEAELKSIRERVLRLDK